MKRSFHPSFAPILVAGFAAAAFGSLARAQIKRIKDINPGTGSSVQASLLWTEYEGLLLFSAFEPRHGRELYLSDGTPSGTRLLRDINPGVANSDPQFFARGGNTVFFLATEAKTGRELWAFNGLKVWLVGDMTPGTGSTWSKSWSPSKEFAPLYYRGKLYFFTTPSLLFETDGSTIRLASIRNCMYLRRFKDRVICRKLMSGYGHELVLTDMTPAGTKLVKDIWPGTRGSFLRDLTVFGDRCYFFAHDGKHGFEPWISDGTTQGTVLLKDISPGIEPTAPSWTSGLWRGRVEGFWRSLGDVFFATSTRLGGQELWVTRGTAASTKQVTDLAKGFQGSWPSRVTPSPRGVVFSVESVLAPPTIRGLYSLVLFGATPGVIRLTTDRGGQMLPVGDRYLWFTGGRLVGVSGEEVWRSDYTAAGTGLFRDFVPGRGSFFPRDYVLGRGKIYLRGWTPSGGFEPYVLDPGAHSKPHGRGCSSSGGEPRLSTSDPVLGGSFGFRGWDAPVSAAPPAAVLTLFGAPVKNPGSVGGCQVHPDLAKPTITFVSSISQKTWKVALGKVPNDPNLVGAEIEVQTFFLTKGGLAATNGVRLYPGK